MNGLLARSFADRDAGPLAVVFHCAVQGGTGGHYSPEERDAWCPAPPSGEAWLVRLRDADTVVADVDGVPVGFLSVIPATGHVDLAYVLPEVMGRGVADALYAVAEGRARARGTTRLTTEASGVARSFFLRNGWREIRRQEVERRGVPLVSFVMEKALPQREVRAA